MPQSAAVTTSSGEKAFKIFVALALFCGAVAAFIYGYWGWGLAALFVSFCFLSHAFLLSGKANCPVCARPLSGLGPVSTCGCPKCRTYFRTKDGQLEEIAAATVADEYTFATRLPWEDLADQTMLEPLGSMPTLNTTTRPLNAAWPEGCCVCGQASTRTDAFTCSVLNKRGFLDKKVIIEVSGVPYCEKCKKGVAVDYDRGNTDLGGIFLVFRSYAYFKAFRKLNSW